MNYIPENPHRHNPDYLADVVCTDEYRFEMLTSKYKDIKGNETTATIPTLRCYTNGRRTNVFIEVEYVRKNRDDEEEESGIDMYTKLPLSEGSLELLAAWFAMQDKKPF